MRRGIISISAVAAMLPLTVAAQQYNRVPAGDAVYARCLSDAAANYQGGGSASPLSGQTKAQAWCGCLWNETPDNFNGNLTEFAESPKGANKNATCQEYADWKMPKAVSASPLAEIDKLDGALIEAWQKAPFSIRRAFFVAEPSSGFGVYKTRGSNTFKAGEPILIYVEPVAFGWKEVSDGMFEIDLVADMSIEFKGKVVGESKGASRISVQSYARNREVKLDLTANLRGAPAGDYIVKVQLHDMNKTQSVDFSSPVKITD